MYFATPFPLRDIGRVGVFHHIKPISIRVQPVARSQRSMSPDLGRQQTAEQVRFRL